MSHADITLPALPQSGSMQGILSSIIELTRDKDLKPGARLPSERDLAQHFNVSRNTIREALTLLEWMRVVERKPNSGIYLQPRQAECSLEALVLCADLGLPLSRKDVAEMTEVRKILEVQAVDLACKRRSDEDLERMSEILRQTERKLSAGESVAEEDARFHIALVAATRNDILVRSVHPIYLISRQRRHFYFSRPEHGKRSLSDHRQILRAVRERDAALAVQQVEQHLGRVDTYWTEFVARQLQPV